MTKLVAVRQPILQISPPSPKASFLCEVIRGTRYSATWHFHPEHQLTLVIKSRGYRIVGDSMEQLRSGDLVLVGANLPHVWHQDAKDCTSDDDVHAIVVRFTDVFMGEDFMQKPELEGVRNLLRRASRGFKIGGKTRQEVTAKMMRLADTEGLARLVELLAVLHLLAESKDLRPLASPGYSPLLSEEDQDRMSRVLRYIHSHLHLEIDRDEAAGHAHLSEGAFSRFFKARTGRTLPQYVNELRISRACTLLAESDRKVVDIAEECGFENLANFNRQFLRLMKKSPRDWRREFQKHAWAS